MKLASTEINLTHNNTIDELKKYSEQRFSELEEHFSKNLFVAVKDEIKAVVEKQDRKIEQLESAVAVLRQHVSSLKESMESESYNFEDLEQYGRRLCLRLDGFPTAKDESSLK